MIDQSNRFSFSTFRGRGWVFLLEPVSASSPASIKRFTDHPLTKGELVGGMGSLCLYRYTDSPFGPYDELYYSPGWYEYLNIHNTRPEATAKRITKCYVSCAETDIQIIRSRWGIPAERATFAWQSPASNEIVVEVTMPNGERIIELTFRQTSFPVFTINSASIMSNEMDFAKLVPVAQPLLDGNQAPIPQNILPSSPLLQSAPLLKMYTSIKANSGTTTLVRAVTNAELFPPVEEIGVSRYGLALTEAKMTLSVPEVVLDVVNPGQQRSSSVWNAISGWIHAIVLSKIG